MFHVPGAKWGDWYWPSWLSFVAISILIPEIYALVTNVRDTLSWFVWEQFQMNTDQQLPWTAAHYLTFGAWLTLMTWLTWHFFFRRFT